MLAEGLANSTAAVQPGRVQYWGQADGVTGGVCLGQSFNPARLVARYDSAAAFLSSTTLQLPPSCQGKPLINPHPRVSSVARPIRYVPWYMSMNHDWHFNGRKEQSSQFFPGSSCLPEEAIKPHMLGAAPRLAGVSVLRRKARLSNLWGNKRFGVRSGLASQSCAGCHAAWISKAEHGSAKPEHSVRPA